LQENHYIRYEDLPLKTKRGEKRDIEVVANLYEEEDKRKKISRLFNTTSGILARARNLNGRRMSLYPWQAMN